jgi:hypothetical protein
LKSAGIQSRFGSSLQEVSMNWNGWVRQIHRWLSIAFTVAVIVNIVALAQAEQAVWVGLLALLPLVLLLLTGLYLFALPYAASGANLTFESRLRRGSSSNVKFMKAPLET